MRTHRNSNTEILEQPKTTWKGCQSPTPRVILKLGLGWYRHSV